ncbi:anthrone oxygenase family protein [Spirosoma koreense]
MTLKIAQFIQTVLFCILAGQAFFYLIGGTAGLKNVSASTFIEQRKAIDLVIGPYLKVIYFGSILTGLMVLVLIRQQAPSRLFVLSTVALVLIIVDLVIAVRGNIPLNNQIQTWSPTHYPANWSEVRNQWLGYMQWRQVCSISGLFCLLLGLFGQL